MTQQAKIIEQLTLLRRLQEQRFRWYHHLNNPNADPLMIGSVANIIITTKAQIADLDKQIDAAGGLLMDTQGFDNITTDLDYDTPAEKIEDRMINAYEEIITDPNEPALPEEVMTLLRNQQMEIRQQIQ